MFVTTANILSTLESHFHLCSSLPSAVPCHVSTSMIFRLFLFSFFSRHSPLALVTIIGSIAPPRRSLPISFGCAVPSSFPLLFTISKFVLLHVFFCCFHQRCLCGLSAYCLFLLPALPTAKLSKRFVLTRGSRSTITVSTTPVKEAVVNLAVTPPDKSRRHLSQREIASELQISKGTISKILVNSDLKCYRVS